MCPAATVEEVPDVEIPDVIGDVCWHAVAFEEVQENVYVSPWFRVTGPSEPLALMSTVNTPGTTGTIGAGARATTTESVAFVMPSVQVMVKVTGALTDG